MTPKGVQCWLILCWYLLKIKDGNEIMSIKNISFNVLIVVNVLFGQGLLEIYTDSALYSYGQPIKINVSILNNTDSSFILNGSSTCQAQFILNGFNSSENTNCTADNLELRFDPGDKRIWSWTFDPKRFGIPSKDGQQTLIGYYNDMSDTTYFNAPEYNGGQLQLCIPLEAWADTLALLRLDEIKNNVNYEVIESVEFISVYFETWQITGTSIDSLMSEFSNDTLLNPISFSFKRNIQFDSVSVTSVDHENFFPKSYYISEVFPNPFNPQTSIKVLLEKNQYVEIDIYNALGQKINSVFNGIIVANREYMYKFNAKGLASGLYFIQVRSKEFIEIRKALLTK